MFAVRDRVQGLHLPDDKPIASVAALPLATFLPNVDDCVALRGEFIVLVSRILIRHLPWFSCLKPVVPAHIEHEYTNLMATKSEIVSVTNFILVCACKYVATYKYYTTGAVRCPNEE